MAQLFPRAVVARALMLVPMVAVAACSDGVGPSASSRASVAFRVAPATSGLSPSRMLGDSTPTVPASDITLTKVQVVLSHIELSRIDSACVRADTTDDDKDEGDSMFCSRISGRIWSWHMSRYRSIIDYSSPARRLGFHQPKRRTCAKKRSSQVDINGCLPVF